MKAFWFPEPSGAVMFDDFVITLKHEGYLPLCFDGWVCTSIKTGNPRPFQETLSDLIETTSIQQQLKTVNSGLTDIEYAIADEVPDNE